MGLFSKDTPKVSLRKNEEAAKRWERDQRRLQNERKAKQIRAHDRRKADRLERQSGSKQKSWWN